MVCQGHGSLLNSYPECFQINGEFCPGYSVFRWLLFEDVLSYEEFENVACNEQNSK
jgi:hypothetical protein